jgi:RNase adaptor protein for sRNA GlmZ degradation
MTQITFTSFKEQLTSSYATLDVDDEQVFFVEASHDSNVLRVYKNEEHIHTFIDDNTLSFAINDESIFAIDLHGHHIYEFKMLTVQRPTA